MKEKKGPTLTDAKGMGGIIAQDGFDYQMWDALVLLPSWLRNPTFEGFAIEVLEDVEARFFTPYAPHRHLLDRFQAKSAVLDRAGITEVVEAFRRFEATHPGVARVQTLVTPALPAKLTWLSRDPGRVRRARPFYGPFSDIRAASDEQLRSDLVAEFGAELGNFFADYVEISLWPMPGRSPAEAAFSATLQQEFPDLEVPVRTLSAVYSALIDLTNQARGSMLTRSRLLDTIRDVAGADLVPNRHVLRVHVRSDRNGQAADALEIDASEFSGGPSGYPPPERWNVALLEPLDATATWARRCEFARIALSGSYRLSTAFALGSAFRSAAGFEIDIQTKTGDWSTDTHPRPSDPVLPWAVTQPHTLLAERLLVGVGILRDPVPSILRTWNLSNNEALLTATLPQALVDGTEAQSSVQTVKAAIAEAVTRLRPAQIDLCYVGPAAFAVALGHRWNAMPPTQLHEFISTDQCYVPTVLLRHFGVELDRGA